MRRLVARLTLLAGCWTALTGGLQAQPDAPVETAGEFLELAVGEQAQLSFPELQRFLVGDPDVVEVERVGRGGLKLTARSAGRTFLHVWTPEGRTTTTLRILPVRLPPPPPPVTEPEAIEPTRPLRLGYDVDYEHRHRGPNVRQSDRQTTTHITHTLTSTMETPFGDTASLMQVQRVDVFQDLTTWWVKLSDGQLGPLAAFDAIGGDTAMPFAGLLGVPSTSYRGATVISRALDPWTGAVLWGRERLGAFVPVSGGGGGERDAFLYGAHVAYQDPSNPWSSRLATLFGYGPDRVPGASDHVVEAAQTFRLSEPWSLTNELAFSDEGYGATLGSIWHSARVHLGATARDVSEDFHTVVGPGPDQGERGVLVETVWHLTQRFWMRARADVFQNRLFPNPAEPDTLNREMEASLDWQLSEQTRLSGIASRQQDLGQLAPFDEVRVGASVSQLLPLVGVPPLFRQVRLLGRVDHIDSRSVNSPSVDTDREIFGAGLSIPLLWGFTATLDHQWHVIKETAIGRRSQPRRLTAGVSHFSSWASGRGALRGRFGYEDETSTPAARSFLAGQDRLIWEAGAAYRPWTWHEVFVDGRIERVRSREAEAGRIEWAVFAGTRTLFDTGVRWEPSTDVEGIVFHDLNGDGLRQPGEEGLSGVAVLAGRRRAVTDAEGRYLVSRVAGKAIPVSVELATLPTGYVLSTTPRQLIRARPGPSPVLFGALGRAEVRGRVFYDVDEDGRYGGADQGVAGVRLQLNARTTKTDQSGWFFFRDLPGGRYVVSLLLDSLPLQYLPKTPLRQELQAQEGQTVTVDFPMSVRRLLEGRVWLDRNRNRQWDAGERAVRDLPICVDGKTAVVTDDHGMFRVRGVAPGPHTLLLNCGMPLPDLLPLSSDHPTVVLSAQDPETITVDFRVEEKAVLLQELIQERQAATGSGH